MFGVEKAETEADIDTLCYEGREEYIYPNTAGFMYKPAGAETIVNANGGIPAVMRTERTTIVNVDVTALGAENKSHAGPVVSLHIVGNTVRQVLRDEIKRLSKPLALGENIAVSLFETEKGKTVLAAINYTPHDNKERVNTEAKIKLNIPEITKAKSDRRLFCGRRNGLLSELRFEVKPYETVFIELY